MLVWLWRGTLVLIAVYAYGACLRAWWRATRPSCMTEEGNVRFIGVIGLGPHMSEKRARRYFTEAGLAHYERSKWFAWLAFAAAVLLVMSWGP
jgi:hypothetical protein